MEHFIILIGGPAKFKGCDKDHDQTWLNYLVPVQIAADKNLYKLRSKEKVYWVVYEPPYKARWTDDSVITAAEKKQDDGYHLHSNRKQAADKISGKGAKSYLDRIKTIASKNKVVYKGISKPAEFWQYLFTFPDASISRVWYSGHASGKELMLSLMHNRSCNAAALLTDTINVNDISGNKKLAVKFVKSPTQVSKFYGCFTKDFAEKWNSVFGVPSAGATHKIDFGVINRPSNIVNLLERIEKTPSGGVNPDWKEFK